MDTLIRIVKTVQGFENWYRDEMTGKIHIEFIPKPGKRGAM